MQSSSILVRATRLRASNRSHPGESVEAREGKALDLLQQSVQEIDQVAFYKESLVSVRTFLGLRLQPVAI